MKVEVYRDKLLSNFEVYQHLAHIQKKNAWFYTVPEDKTKTGKKRKKRKADSLIDLEIITKDLSRYLVQDNQSNDVEVQSIVNLMLGLNMYKLEKIEKLQILNILPRSMVLLYAIIEDCDQRFTEEQCEELLSLVNDNFPLPQEEDEDESGKESESHDEPMNDIPEVDEEDEGIEDMNGELQAEVRTKHKKAADKEEDGD